MAQANKNPLQRGYRGSSKSPVTHFDGMVQALKSGVKNRYSQSPLHPLLTRKLDWIAP